VAVARRTCPRRLVAKSHVAPRFTYFEDLGYAQLICSKVGTWTFAQVYRERYGSNPPPASPTLEELRRLRDSGVFLAQFVRDPFARLISSYEYFARWWELEQTDNVWYPMSKEMRTWRTTVHGIPTFTEYVQAAFVYFPQDKHIAPQYGVHGGLAQLVWPFEDISRGWSIIRGRVSDDLPPTLPRINTSQRTGAQFAPETLQLASDFYADDIIWYIDVCNQSKFRSARSPADYLQ
jgi:hypothetical protein